MLEISVIVQEGDLNGRSGFDVYMVSNKVDKNTGLIYDFLGNSETKEAAEEAASLWKRAFHNFQDNNKKEVNQLKSAGFTFCSIHNSVSRGICCDESVAVIKAHKNNLIQKEMDDEEKNPDKFPAPAIKNSIAIDLLPKEQKRLETKFKIKPLETRECELHQLFYVVPTALN